MLARNAAVVALLALALLAHIPTARAAIAIDTVPVNTTQNTPDATGYGAVGYEFNMATYEVTNRQYIGFLNAVATVGDPYGLWNTGMDSLRGGIGRSGSGTAGAPYSYGPKFGDSGWLDVPVVYVGFWDSTRFANWMHNGQPVGGQDATTTEDGSYTLNGYTGPFGGSIGRNPGATWVIPTEDEWYKAAYYDQALDGGAGGYHKYPMSSSDVPSNVLVNPDPGNNANFYVVSENPADRHTAGAPYWSTPVGEFENSPSPYGTFDMGGNVDEWNETIVKTDGTYSYRGVRGGGWGYVYSGLDATFRHQGGASREDQYVGFRVAVVPEPASLVLLAMGGLALLRSRRS